MDFPKHSIITPLIRCRFIGTNRRLTFDIEWQDPRITFQGEDEDDYYKFVASNGYEIISRSRMDIQTERLWLIGGKPNERSGSMVFSSNKKRDEAYHNFVTALNEWETFVKGAENAGV